MASDNIVSLTISSFNCRGYNAVKRNYISRLSKESDFVFLQEHWLANSQLDVLASIDDKFSHFGISGFDSSAILSGRPFGGCAILWRSSILANIVPVAVDSKRICAVHVCSANWKLLLVNVYMPHEDGDDSTRTDEFVQLLSLIEDLVDSHADSHIVIGGDFNVDFNRNWIHTELLNSFCDNVCLSPIVRHVKCNIDYSYQFSMTRFNILDHFLLSGTLFNTCVDSASVIHDIDNTSDHDPILLRLRLDVKYIGLAKRVFTPRASWAKAANTHLINYRASLSSCLSGISIPSDAIVCSNPKCNCFEHVN